MKIHGAWLHPFRTWRAGSRWTRSDLEIAALRSGFHRITLVEGVDPKLEAQRTLWIADYVRNHGEMPAMPWSNWEHLEAEKQPLHVP